MDWSTRYLEALAFVPAGDPVEALLRGRIDHPDVVHSHGSIVLQAIVVTAHAVFGRKNFHDNNRWPCNYLFNGQLTRDKADIRDPNPRIRHADALFGRT